MNVGTENSAEQCHLPIRSHVCSFATESLCTRAGEAAGTPLGTALRAVSAGEMAFGWTTPLDNMGVGGMGGALLRWGGWECG